MDGTAAKHVSTPYLPKLSFGAMEVWIGLGFFFLPFVFVDLSSRKVLERSWVLIRVRQFSPHTTLQPLGINSLFKVCTKVYFCL